MIGNVRDHGVKRKIPDAVVSTVFALAKCRTRDAYKKALQKLELMDEEVAVWFDERKEQFAAYLFLQAGKPRYGKQLSKKKLSPTNPLCDRMNSYFVLRCFLHFLLFVAAEVAATSTSRRDKERACCWVESQIFHGGNCQIES
jgi:hypothetical protein